MADRHTDVKNTAIPKSGKQRGDFPPSSGGPARLKERTSGDPTAPGSLARPGSERGSATMDARSSVPTSIQESCSAGDTRDRFGTLESGDSDSREDNAEIDAGVGTGRAARGTFRGNRRY